MAVPTWTVAEVLASADVNKWFVPLVGYKTSPLNRTSTTLTDDPDLSIVVAGSAAYEIRCYIIYTCATAGDSVNHTFTFPASATGGYVAGQQSVVSGFVWSQTTLMSNNTPGNVYGYQIDGALFTAASGGTFAFKWATNAGGVTATVGAGSFLTARRIG